jgi:hypothetical protein
MGGKDEPTMRTALFLVASAVLLLTAPSACLPGTALHEAQVEPLPGAPKLARSAFAQVVHERPNCSALANVRIEKESVTDLSRQQCDEAMQEAAEGVGGDVVWVVSYHVVGERDWTACHGKAYRCR